LISTFLSLIVICLVVILFCGCALLTFDKSEAMTITKIAFLFILFALPADRQEFEAKIKGT
jgi:hypothetical protein